MHTMDNISLNLPLSVDIYPSILTFRVSISVYISQFYCMMNLIKQCSTWIQLILTFKLIEWELNWLIFLLFCIRFDSVLSVIKLKQRSSSSSSTSTPNNTRIQNNAANKRWRRLLGRLSSKNRIWKIMRE